jgi:hypothetical protein
MAVVVAALAADDNKDDADDGSSDERGELSGDEKAAVSDTPLWRETLRDDDAYALPLPLALALPLPLALPLLLLLGPRRLEGLATRRRPLSSSASSSLLPPPAPNKSSSKIECDEEDDDDAVDTADIDGDGACCSCGRCRRRSEAGAADAIFARADCESECKVCPLETVADEADASDSKAEASPSREGDA